MRLFFILVLILLNFSTAVGQTLNYDWTKTIGGIEREDAGDIEYDIYGNIIIGGSFGDTVDVDPGNPIDLRITTGLSYTSDVLVEKLDSNGNLIWARTFGSNNGDRLYDLAIDSFGNVFSTGTFRDTADFNPSAGVFNISALGPVDVFIHKMDPNGSFKWVSQIGGNDLIFSRGADLDKSANHISTGYFKGTIDFDPGTTISNRTSLGDNDIYVLKLDSSGSLLWAKQIGGPANDRGIDVVTDNQNNIYVLGEFTGNVDFNPNSGTNFMNSSGGSAFLLKLDAAGNFLWVRQFPMQHIGVDGLSLSPKNNILICGSYTGTADFDPGSSIFNLSSNGSDDACIISVNSNGQFQWANSFGSTGYDIYNSVECDNLGYIYVTGQFSDTIFFNQQIPDTLVSVGSRDIFYQRLRPNGNHFEAYQIEGNDYKLAIASAIFRSELCILGQFENTADFNPSIDPIFGFDIHVSNGQRDLFFTKSSFCIPNQSIDSIRTCSPFTWIDGNTYYSDTVSTFTTQNINGCDSIIKLSLQVESISDTSIFSVNIGQQDSLYTSNSNATYKWLNCDSNYQVVVGQQGQSFIPFVSGNYTVEITEGTCVDTLRCIPALITVGLLSNNKDHIKLYPNPTQGIINILNLESAIEIEILDSKGSLVKKMRYDPESAINIENLRTGIYFIRFLNKSQYESLIIHKI